jgi:hypothetical protein
VFGCSKMPRKAIDATGNVTVSWMMNDKLHWHVCYQYMKWNSDHYLMHIRDDISSVAAVCSMSLLPIHCSTIMLLLQAPAVLRGCHATSASWSQIDEVYGEKLAETISSSSSRCLLLIRSLSDVNPHSPYGQIQGQIEVKFQFSLKSSDCEFLETSKL